MADTAEIMAAPSITGATANTPAADRLGEARKPRKPDDFESVQAFLQYTRTTYGKDMEADQQNRREAILDARFLSGEQWDAAIRERRDRLGKPTLTLNRLPAFVSQLVGNRRLNDVGIKVIPDTGGDRKVAEVREGLMRSIQKVSRAQYVYDKAFEQQVVGGIGNFEIRLDYAHDDVFEQDINVSAIPNPLAVVWDQDSTEPTGADARHVFVVDRMKRADFKEAYPDAHAGDWDSEMTAGRTHGWDTSDSVQVVTFWRMRSRKRTVALMKDGTVQDVTDIEPEMWFDLVEERDGMPMVREVHRKYAEMYLCSSQDILAGPYELPIQRVPVFRVPGWEVFIEGERKRWGLIRFLRDPQKLHNMWRSVIAEKLVGSPKAKWLASNTAVEGREQDWRDSHLSEDPLLVYNAEAGTAPQRMPPVEMEAALIQEAGMAAQDIRDISNIHEASLGQRSNEVSGRAIMARQRVGEIGTVVFTDNLNMAIEEAGKVINQLIPFVYDTPRIIKVLGEDMMSERLVKINSASPDSVDITTGKYSVSIVTGPSYTTRRVESREEMMAMVNAMPQTMGIAADKIVEAQDWPGADEIARRLRSQLPPGMVSMEDMTEEEQAMAQQQQEAAQQQQQLEMQQLQLDMAEREVEVTLKRARAIEAEARAIESQARAQQALALAAKAASEVGVQRAKSALDAIQSIYPEPADPGAER